MNHDHKVIQFRLEWTTLKVFRCTVEGLPFVLYVLLAIVIILIFITVIV